MPHPVAYLAFNGNCAEAMGFYEHALAEGGKVTMAMQPAHQSPDHRGQRRTWPLKRRTHRK